MARSNSRALHALRSGNCLNLCPVQHSGLARVALDGCATADLPRLRWCLRAEAFGVAAQLGDLLAAGDVEKADGVVAAAGGQPRAVGAERHGMDNIPQPGGLEQLVGMV